MVIVFQQLFAQQALQKEYVFGLSCKTN